MKKIQFDTVRGVEPVPFFDDGIEIIPESSVFDLLRSADPAKVYGCTVSTDTYKAIKAEYGIR